MSRRDDFFLVRVVGVFAVLVVAVALWMAVVNRGLEKVPETGLHGGLMNRGTALQFVETGSDVGEVLGTDTAHNARVLRRLILIDFLWIGCYAFLFLAISLMLRKRSCPWARYLGWLALVAGVTAAAFDVRENINMLNALDCFPCDFDPRLLNAINDSALAKWTMSFVAIALLAIAFQDLPSRLAHWISRIFILTALIGLIGLWRHQALFFVAVLLLVGLLLLAFTAFFRPRALKAGECC